MIKYDASRICGTFDDSLFVSGNIHQLNNDIIITWDKCDVSIDSTSGTGDLIANSNPSGCACSVFPKTGGQELLDTFYFTCHGWSDNDTNNNNNNTLTYNFFQSSSLKFLNIYYEWIVVAFD